MFLSRSLTDKNASIIKEMGRTCIMFKYLNKVDSGVKVPKNKYMNTQEAEKISKCRFTC